MPKETQNKEAANALEKGNSNNNKIEREREKENKKKIKRKRKRGQQRRPGESRARSLAQLLQQAAT